jgi:hypothetical protein
MKIRIAVFAASALTVVARTTTKQSTKTTETQPVLEAAPAPPEPPPEAPLKSAYFGETHVHTSASMDAFIAGTRLSVSDAYRFAKGEEVTVKRRTSRSPSVSTGSTCWLP